MMSMEWTLRMEAGSRATNQMAILEGVADDEMTKIRLRLCDEAPEMTYESTADMLYRQCHSD